jgi:hypothetical protein
MTRNKPPSCSRPEGALYAGSENWKTSTAGREVMIAMPNATAASAVSAANGWDSNQAHQRRLTIDTSPTYRAALEAPSAFRQRPLPLRTDVMSPFAEAEVWATDSWATHAKASSVH